MENPTSTAARRRSPYCIVSQNNLPKDEHVWDYDTTAHIIKMGENSTYPNPPQASIADTVFVKKTPYVSIIGRIAAIENDTSIERKALQRRIVKIKNKYNDSEQLITTTYLFAAIASALCECSKSTK